MANMKKLINFAVFQFKVTCFITGIFYEINQFKVLFPSGRNCLKLESILVSLSVSLKRWQTVIDTALRVPQII